MSTVTSLAQMVEIRNNVFQLDNNPYISAADKTLLSSVLDINSRFSTVTRWDDIIIATKQDIENQTTLIMQRDNDNYITFSKNLSTTTPQPSQEWTRVTQNMVKNFRDNPVGGLTDPSANNLTNHVITDGYLNVLKSLFREICNLKYQNEDHFRPDYFDRLTNHIRDNTDVQININGEISYISYSSYLRFCKDVIAGVLGTGTYTATTLQIFLIVFRPWLIATYLTKLIRNIQDSATTNKPRTLYMQSVLSVVFRLYIIQTYLILKQLLTTNVNLNGLIEYERNLLLKQSGGTEANNTQNTVVFSELGNILTVATETNNKIMAVGSALEQQKINLEKALANDISATSRLNNWMIMFWVVFSLLVLILSLGAVTIYMPDNEILRAITIYTCSTALLAIIIYWLVLAIKK